MFSGIVSNTFEVREFIPQKESALIEVALNPELCSGLELGASVAVNGVCLTVTKIAESVVSFDVIKPTLERTNLGRLRVGTIVNIERSLKEGQEIGGHEVSGHVDATGAVRAINKSGENHQLVIELESKWLQYLFPHGFVAINGVSLTVSQVDREQGYFDVWLIPETLRRTNLSALAEGEPVNIEVHRGTQVVVDVLRATTKEFLTELVSKGELGADTLQKLLGLVKGK